jgi:hypothetical protein
VFWNPRVGPDPTPVKQPAGAHHLQPRPLLARRLHEHPVALPHVYEVDRERAGARRRGADQGSLSSMPR